MLENKTWISVLRVVATLSVILLHVSTPLVLDFSTPIAMDWYVGNVYDSMARFCVPIFVMVTGALLLPQQIELSSFFRKRVRRVFVPFIFWSLVYILFTMASDYLKEGNLLSLGGVVSYVVEKLLHGAYYHFWYIYMLLGLYLVIPILSKWVRYCTQREIRYFLLVWLITLYMGDRNCFSTVKPLYFTGYIGYLVLGYYLSVASFKLSPIRMRALSALLFIVGSVYTALSTFVVSYKDGVFHEAFYEYLTFNVLLAAIGVFLYFKTSVFSNNSLFIKVVSVIDRYSYGIFLVHVLVLGLLMRMGVYGSFINPILGIPLLTLICLVVSFAVVYLVRKLPFGKYISG